MSSRLLALAALPLAFSCGSPPRPSAQAQPAPKTAPEGDAPSVSSAATRPAAPVASAAASAVAAPAAPSFHVVNEIGYPPLALLKLRETVIASGGAIFATLGDAGIQQDALFSQGLPLDFWVPVTGLAGSPGGEMWATVIRSNGRVGWGELYRKSRRGWSSQGGPLPQTHVYVGISEWTNGRVLALSGSDWSPQGASFKFQIIAGPAAPLPQLTPAKHASDKDAGYDCGQFKGLQFPKQFAALPSGDVFVVGTTCHPLGTVVEHFEPQQVKSVVHAFPDSGGWDTWKLLVRSEREVVLLAEDKKALVLARFDGSSWTTEKLNFGGALVDADCAPDGTLFVIAPSEAGKDLPNRLWWRPPGQSSFSELFVSNPAPQVERWPQSFRGVTAVAAKSRDDIWVMSGGSLFHTRPAPGGSSKIEAYPEGQRVASLTLPRAATPDCKNVYVLLYGVTKTTPPSYDYPLTRKALGGRPEFKDVRLVETEENGRRFFGAFVKDLEQGKLLAKRVVDSVPGSVPAVLCAQPKVLREIVLDSTAGVQR